MRYFYDIHWKCLYAVEEKNITYGKRIMEFIINNSIIICQKDELIEITEEEFNTYKLSDQDMVVER